MQAGPSRSLTERLRGAALLVRPRCTAMSRVTAAATGRQRPSSWSLPSDSALRHFWLGRMANRH